LTGLQKALVVALGGAMLAALLLARATANAGPGARGVRQPKLEVEDARLGLGVVDRELIDEATDFYLKDRVYLWMRVKGGEADSIFATWTSEHTEFRARLFIRGTPWRTWCYRTAWEPGLWKVRVTDGTGRFLRERFFEVGEEERQADGGSEEGAAARSEGDEEQEPRDRSEQESEQESEQKPERESQRPAGDPDGQAPGD